MIKDPFPGRQGGRPRSVTITAWGVFLIGLANVWRAIGLGRQSRILLDLEARPDPRLLLVLASIWAFVLLVAAAALWRRRPAVRLAIPILLLAYGLYQLGLLLLFAQSAESRSAWPALAVQHATGIILATWALNRRPARTYFRQTGVRAEKPVRHHQRA